MNRIPAHKEGTRLLDFQGAQVASGWTQSQGLVEAVNIPQFYQKNKGERPLIT